jgi:FAD-dependent oxidoreductase domain-containing protein 1
MGLLDPAALSARFPWLNTDGLAMGSLGLALEGFFDPYSLLTWFTHMAKAAGAVYVDGSVEAVGLAGGRVASVTVAQPSGRDTLACGVLVNACGAWSGALAAAAGLPAFPVVPRRRVVFVVTSSHGQSLSDAPLVVDPSGVYFRPDGQRHFLCGVSPEVDPDSDGLGADLEVTAADHEQLFDGVVWPALAHRVPAFESLRVTRSWAGYYDYNTLDQNALLGWHPAVPNLAVCTGFSGHGIQQAPAAGRAVAELVALGRYVSIDVSALGVERYLQGRQVLEKNVV